ncbi:23S rRNA (uracil(1939)-C(5))-methyltransferase RlmD [Cellulosilyticum sp. I15G10I2]|uniref:23S rRNA (uracil(1939)-C(5))-methyltransferase RlmD n=1 Tax=Cellulosilyticum sp. I15G10I2 TaxID=1892843 RepID=UPI00085C7A3B|nr:23S rRNA (uracil(1939)-C(5))-methyltransferase RlmD [Cellulosilyticum sp. I15G10I2]
MPKKNQILEGLIEDAVFPNKGIMLINNEPIYVTGTFKGQVVKARIIKKKNQKWEARLLEVLEHPDYLTDPCCSYFGACGGCSTQHLPYTMQLDLKHQQVTRLLKDAGITEYEDLGILASPEVTEYRNKMEFSFGDAVKDGPMTLGMHKKSSTYDIITVGGCKLVDPDFTTILEYTLDYCVKHHLDYYKKLIHTGFMRYLVIRKSKTFGKILINIVTSSQKDFSFTELAKELSALKLQGTVTGVLHTITDTLSDAVKPDSTSLVYGTDTITEKILGLEFKISPFSFFQTNTQGAEVLYKNALNLIQNMDNKVVFDLYCGTGTITQIMATRAKKVYGIEIVEEAVEKARENAAFNQLTNCEFIAGDVLTEVDKLNAAPDIIVLDPPRDGIHPKAIQKIINFNAKELLYISCKPTSLARDLPILKAAGYTIDKLMCVDMFPQTPHVETVVKLSR